MRKFKTVSQIAKLAGVSNSTIRRYADKGEIRCKRQPGSNYRLFDLEEATKDLEKLRIIAP